MPHSIDFSNYVDLTLYDTDAAEILNEILTSARGLLPSWQPEAGNIEVVLAEAIANASADLSSYINRLPDATAEVLLQLFGIFRSDGVKATGSVTATMVDDAGYTVAAGTPLAYFATSGQSYVFYTDDDLIVPNASTSGNVNVTAQAVGTASNSANNGDALQVLVNLPYMNSVVFLDGPSGGANSETDEEYFDRAAGTLASFSSAITTASQIQAYVLANFSVAYRCQSFNKRRYRDRDTTAVGYTTHPGYVLVAVAGQNADQAVITDITVSPSAMSEIDSAVEERTSAGLVIDVMSAELVRVTVTSSFFTLPGFDPAAIENSVDAALDAYLDPNTWDWSKNVVRVNEIIAVIDGVAGVDYVGSVSLSAATEIGTSNFTTATDVTLHNLGTLVVGGTHNLSATATV